VVRVVAATVLLGCVLAAAPASALAVGELEQKAGAAGCLSATLPECTPARGLLQPVDVAVSPDGVSVYSVALGSAAVGVYRRDPASGELSQLLGQQGCVAAGGSQDGCAEAIGGADMVALAVSPDGTSIYVATGAGILVFDRDPLTGGLQQKAKRAGCIVGESGPSICSNGFLLDEVRDVVVSPDGRSVYVATIYGVLGFARDPLTGELAQRTGSGCIVGLDGEPCSTGRLLGVAIGLGMSPDGRSLYVATQSEFEPAAITVLDVDPGSGHLEQEAGAAACVIDLAYGGSECGVATGLAEPLTAVVSPDGESVYVGRRGGLVVFDRTVAGHLMQKPGIAGCVSADGDGGSCAVVPSFSAQSLALSSSGLSLYSSSGAMDSIWSFDRVAGGGLTLKPGLVGCISETGGPSCRDGRALDGPVATALSPDGSSLYAASLFSNAMAVFDRESTGEVIPDTSIGVRVGDVIAPSVSRFRLTRRRFRVGRRPTPILLPSRVRAGSAFRFGLSERASVRLEIARALAGRVVGERCRPPSRRLQRHRRCTRWTRVGLLRRRDLPAGPIRLRFSGRIGRQALRPGRYRATIIAADGAGNHSFPRGASFTITRRHVG
jgi:DNA-binding beta-propeller fold protein YncE